MKIEILNRPDIEELAKRPFKEKTALISITDYDDEYAELQYKPEYLLQIKFDDVDNDIFLDLQGKTLPEEKHKDIAIKYHIITDEQAKEIANFVMNIKDKAEFIICQCEHGQSRSAAVAAAITEYLYNDGIKIFSSDDYFPNKVVYRKVYEYLK
jgi:predicted protein tyrosine phosphatase